MKADGYKIINNIIEKFYDSENTLIQLLSLIDSTLKSLHDKETALQISGDGFVNKLITIIEKNDFQGCTDISYDIINKIVFFENTHDNCIK